MGRIGREVYCMLHVLMGEDDYSMRQALDKVKAGIGDATALMTNTTVLDGKQVSEAELRAACETMPFLSEKRLVIVNGLLERFDGGGKRGRRKTVAKNSKTEEWEPFAALAKSIPEFTELVLMGGVVKPANPLLAELTSTGRVFSFPALKPRELREWTERRVKNEGAQISPKALDTLCRFVGNDLWLMSSEIEKLILYTGGRTIEEEDITAVVSATREANVFAMVDAILEGRAGTAQELYTRLLADGAVPTQLLVLVSRQVRIIYQLREMRRAKKSRNEIRTALGLNSDFLMNKAWEQADKYSLKRLEEIYHRLLDTDLAIKTGRFDGELALTIFIGKMV
jgi:DNA polymerase III subunit delta